MSIRGHHTPTIRQACAALGLAGLVSVLAATFVAAIRPSSERYRHRIVRTLDELDISIPPKQARHRAAGAEGQPAGGRQASGDGQRSTAATRNVPLRDSVVVIDRVDANDARVVTVVRWHRRGFELYWRCRSRPRAAGRQASAERKDMAERGL